MGHNQRTTWIPQSLEQHWHHAELSRHGRALDTSDAFPTIAGAEDQWQPSASLGISKGCPQAIPQFHKSCDFHEIQQCYALTMSLEKSHTWPCWGEDGVIGHLRCPSREEWLDSWTNVVPSVSSDDILIEQEQLTWEIVIYRRPWHNVSLSNFLCYN